MQLLVGQQNVAAGAPALGDVVPFAGRYGLQHGVDDRQQLRVVGVNGKAETMGFLFAEIGHANVVQITLVDHVVGGNGVTQKHVSLIESHRVDCVLIGGIGRQDGFGILRLDLILGQIVIDHAQPQTGQTFGQRAGLAFAGNQNRLIDGVGR